MGLKEDARFARFITMGALGAKRVADDLTRRGHSIIELERYAMANKIWTTKVKRLRMADLLCVSCGRRFEAKAKTKLEVKLSDSKQPGRGWSDGMRADDVFAFLPVLLDANNRPNTVGNPLYLTTASMRSVAPKQGQLKSATDGSERDVYWPITVAKRVGVVTGVRDGRVTITPPDARSSTLGRPSDKPLVRVGDHVDEGTVLGSTVAPATRLDCPGATWNLSDAIECSDEVEVFAAVKTVGVLKVEDLAEAVRGFADDDGQDVRLRIEALGALAAAMLARSCSIRELIAALSDRERRDWALQALGQITPTAMLDLYEQLDAADRAVLDALWRRNLRDTHNEPTNLTELQFLTAQSLRAANSRLV